MKHSSSNLYAFTEQGIAILFAVRKSDIVIEVSRSIKILYKFNKKILEFKIRGGIMTIK
mgnify:CR=1 FL=1